MAILKYELPYFHDSARLFACIKHMHWPMFLDSGQALNPDTKQPGSQFGRYDILVAEPVMTFVTEGVVTTIAENGETISVQEDPFKLIKSTLKKYTAEKSNYPFAGGALGYFGYDLGRHIESLPNIAMDDTQVPEMMVGIYDWAVVVDHREKRANLVSHGFHTSTEYWQKLCALFEQVIPEQQTKFSVDTPVYSNFDFAAYQYAYNRVLDYIHAGDCYQVNLAQRFSARVHGDSWVCYQKLRELSPAPFMAYMDLAYGQRKSIKILSASPERFLQLVDNMVETRPIKGTRPRFSNPKQDLGSAIELLTSFKDRAENVMIVDLLRNDLGKVCDIGSIKADKLFNLQSFANVHHLVSFVAGRLNPAYSAVDLLRSCFPGGSITGAPKLRAMQIIEELEPHRRGVYCGAIGYIGFDGEMDTSISIRTAVIVDGGIFFHAGGGLVADSNLEKEFKETLDKASNFLTTMKYFME